MNKPENRPKTTETEIQNEGQNEAPVAVLEMSEKQVQEYADQAILETDQELTNFNSEAEESIEASAKTMGVSGELVKEARITQGLDNKLWQVKSEARTIQMAAKLDIKDVLGEVDKEDPIVKRLKETLDNEMQGIDDEMQGLREFEARQEKEARDVKELAKKHECFFVHTFSGFEKKTGSVFREGGVDAPTQIKILLGIEPTISTSTIRKDQDENNAVSEVGVLLSEGEIVNASPEDSRSVPAGRGERKAQGLGNPKYKLESREAIDNAIKEGGKHRDKYNELGMKKPKVAGIFLALKGDLSVKQYEDSYDQLTLSGKIPLYAMKDGVLHRVTCDKSGERPRLILGSEAVKPGDVSKDAPEFSDDEKEEIVSELSENLPFKTESLDYPKVEGYSDGEQFYLKERVLKNFEENNQKYSPGQYKPDEKEIWESTNPDNFSIEKTAPKLAKGDTFYPLGEFKSLNGETSFFAVKNQKGEWEIYQKEKKLLLGKDEPASITVKRYDRGYPRDTASIGFGHNWGGIQFKRDNFVDNYLNSVKERAETTVEKIDDDEKFKKERKSVRNQMAYQVYGFGVQAGKFGDKDAQEKAFKLAAELDPDENFEKTMQERLGKTGGYRGTKKEVRMEE